MADLLTWFNSTIVAAIIAGIVSLLVSRGGLYINAVTAQRSQWIDKLRVNLAKFSGLVHTLNFKSQTNDLTYLITSNEYQSLVREMKDLSSLLKLQLNPAGEIDKNIILLVERIVIFSESPMRTELRQADALLILHSQWLLKAEWEKVKLEARGAYLRPWTATSAHFFMQRYRKFCSAEGALPM